MIHRPRRRRRTHRCPNFVSMRWLAPCFGCAMLSGGALMAQTRPAVVAPRPAGVTGTATTRPAIPTTRESRYSRSADAEIRFQEGLLHYQGQRLAQAETDFKD